MLRGRSLRRLGARRSWPETPAPMTQHEQRDRQPADRIGQPSMDHASSGGVRSPHERREARDDESKQKRTKNDHNGDQADLAAGGKARIEAGEAGDGRDEGPGRPCPPPRGGARSSDRRLAPTATHPGRSLGGRPSRRPPLRRCIRRTNGGGNRSQRGGRSIGSAYRPHTGGLDRVVRAAT